MAFGKGLQIEADDFNTIRNKIVNVLGPGAGNFGYGQTIQSSPVSPGNEIEAAQWNRLRWDIFNTIFHQTGAQPSIVIANNSNVIKFDEGEPVVEYNKLSDQAIQNRFNIGTGRFSVESGINVSQAVSFSVVARCTITVNFNTADQARHFFNSGGKIRFSSTRTGGSITTQNTSWTNLLSSIGTISFDGNSSGVNFYNLTSAEQTWFSQKPSGVYGVNEYKISVSCNQPSNISGTANQLIFKVEWIDSYVDPGPPLPDDGVDGTLNLLVDQVRATGIIEPINAPFLIVGPSYLSSGFVTT